MRFSFWPQSLFGRLIAASVLALLFAQVASLVMVAREREHFVLQGTVREWSRRIAELTAMLQGMDATERAATAARLTEHPVHFPRRASDIRFRNGGFPDLGLDRAGPRESDPRESDIHRPLAGGPHGPDGPADGEPSGPPPDLPAPSEPARGWLTRATTLQWLAFSTRASEFESAFQQQLQAALGNGFGVKVTPTSDPAKRVISIGGPLFSESRDGTSEPYDVSVRFPDGYIAEFRVVRLVRGTSLPRVLFVNLALLVIVMAVALFVTARSITRPLSELARAADSVGRDLRQPRLAERGARELRHAARAFNTMQDRLQRYLDSRSRVLAAMSHDLKTPLTRLRLQAEMLEDSAAQARIGKQLDEMESMVHGALALFRGLDDDEAFTPVDVNELLSTLQSEFAEMSAPVRVEGRAVRSFLGKPQALRRCLTNLIANAVKFGSQAVVSVEDGSTLTIRIRDEGPGIPEDLLERVFEPFYRVESSRNRDTGGTGLGLSIARDVIQAHGGTLALRNLPVRGLEAIVTLPRT
jgi:signal transduction histidine kinase